MDRSLPVQKAECHEYLDKAKAGGKLSAIIKSHVFTDFVSVERRGEVSIAFLIEKGI